MCPPFPQVNIIHGSLADAKLSCYFALRHFLRCQLANLKHFANGKFGHPILLTRVVGKVILQCVCCIFLVCIPFQIDSTVVRFDAVDVVDNSFVGWICMKGTANQSVNGERLRAFFAEKNKQVPVAACDLLQNPLFDSHNKSITPNQFSFERPNTAKVADFIKPFKSLDWFPSFHEKEKGIQTVAINPQVRAGCRMDANILSLQGITLRIDSDANLNKISQ